MLSFIVFMLLVAIGYLCGSFCSAVIVCRVFGLPDPRTEGSKNPGATNVLRLAGKKYALIVLIVDMLKGLLPVLLARLADASPVTLGFTCFAAVMGHMYPVFFGFKGGKGVATALGGLLGLNFILGVMVIATWLLVAQYSRYSSLASIVSVILMPLYSTVTIGNIQIIPPLFFITIFILYQHRENFSRLFDGTETKIQFRPSNLKEVTDEILATHPSTIKSEEMGPDIITKEDVTTEDVAEEDKPRKASDEKKK